MKLAKMTTF